MNKTHFDYSFSRRHRQCQHCYWPVNIILSEETELVKFIPLVTYGKVSNTFLWKEWMFKIQLFCKNIEVGSRAPDAAMYSLLATSSWCCATQCRDGSKGQQKPTLWEGCQGGESCAASTGRQTSTFQGCCMAW